MGGGGGGYYHTLLNKHVSRVSSESGTGNTVVGQSLRVVIFIGLRFQGDVTCLAKIDKGDKYVFY